MRLRLEQQEDDIRNLDMRCSTQEEMVRAESGTSKRLCSSHGTVGSPYAPVLPGGREETWFFFVALPILQSISKT